MNGPGTIRAGVFAVAACGMLVIGLPAAQMARAEPPGHDTAALWREDFDHAPPDFVDPAHHDAAAVAQAYAVRVVDGNSVLHARHDGTRGTTPAIHYGRAFERDPPALDGVSALRWRWRVLHHPDVDRDPWADVAASLYVLTKAPSLLRSGRGFKFGWIARPGPENTYQRGILQVALRAGGPLGEWHAESNRPMRALQAHVRAVRGRARPVRGGHDRRRRDAFGRRGGIRRVRASRRPCIVTVATGQPNRPNQSTHPA